MSLSSTTNRVAYLGDGSSATFSFPYYFFTQADLKVYLYRTTTDAIENQIINTNYTVSGSVNAQGLYPGGASVVMASAILSSVYIVITRDPAQQQNFILQQNGLIPSAALTQQLDYLTLLIQRQQDINSSCVRLGDGFGNIFNPVLPSGIPFASSMVLGFNSSGTGFQYLNLNGTAAFGPAGYVYTGNGSSAAASFQTVTIGNSGIVAALNGGTGIGANFIQYGLLYASSSTQVAIVPSTTAGSYLVANGSSAPTYSTFAATQSQMESASSIVLAVTPSRQHFHPGMPKAWAKCAVSGSTVTIQESYNCSSVSAGANSIYTVTFASAMTGSGYSIIVSGRHQVGVTAQNIMNIDSGNQTTTTFRIKANTDAGANSVPEAFDFMVFGDMP